MPRYDFKCNKCKRVLEMDMPYENRDETMSCKCGGTIKRAWLTTPALKGFNKHGSSIN